MSSPKMPPLSHILTRWTLLDLTLLLALFSIAASADDGNKTTIYDVLRANGLPPGLIPKGVQDFRMTEDGDFEVRLESSCNAKFEGEVHYEANMSGSISYGRIGELKGVSAQELFLWLPIKAVRVDIPSSGLIYLDVGVARKQLSLSLFDAPPDCYAAGDAAPLVKAENVISEAEKSQLRSVFQHEHDLAGLELF